MAKDINLLPQLMEEEVRRSTYRRYGSVLSITILGIVGLVVVGLFLWLFIIDNSLNKVNQDISSREQSIRDNAEKELQVRALATKVKLIKPMVSTPYTYSEVLTKIQNLVSVSPSMETTNLELEGDQVTFTGRSPGSQPIQDFFSALLDPDNGGKNFKKVVLTSLNRSDNLNEYRFGLQMVFFPDQKGQNNAREN